MRKRQQRRNLIVIALMLVALICLVAVLAILVNRDRAAQETNAKRDELLTGMDALGEDVNPGGMDGIAENIPSDNSPETEATASPEPEKKPYTSPYEVLGQYTDMKGWLVVPGTNIDYPIMQREGDDEYYLYRDYKGGEDIAGSLILDEDSSVDPMTTNLLIHGHNMKNGTMFRDLMSYEKEDYYKEHKTVKLYTEKGEYEYEVIAAFRSQIYYKSDVVFKYYNFFQADNEQEFNYFYENIKKLSAYDTGVTAQFGDKFITLSTCAYHVEDGRFVVVAKLVNSIEEGQ